MSLLRRLAFLRKRNPNSFVSKSGVSQRRDFFTSIFGRSHSVSTSSESVSSEENPTPETKTKRFSVFFKEAVGLSPRTEDPINDGESGSSDLSRELKQLETKIRSLNDQQGSVKVDAVFTNKEGKEKAVKVGAVVANKEGKEKKGKHNKPAAPSLVAIFTGSSKPRVVSGLLPEASVTVEKLSPEMEMFVNQLHSEGYFSGANFVKDGKFVPGWYKHSCGRDYIKFASNKFGHDHQEIAKLLLSSELKKVALFGCPSVASKVTDAAKRLRIFFEIPEHTVCSKCALRSSCKFMNQQLRPAITKKSKNGLSLPNVLSVITLYSLELVPPELSIPSDLKLSVNRLLTHIVALSQTTTEVKVKI